MTPTNVLGDTNELVFGCINVCGLERRVQFPEFCETLSDLDILCVTETTCNPTDTISIPGYGFLSQERKQNCIRSSGGIAVIYSSLLEGKLEIIPTDSAVTT